MSVDIAYCPLEGAKQSDDSPDKVQNCERVGRFIYHEEQADERGTLKKGAFQMSEFIDPRRRGASVARVEHSDAEELRRIGQEVSGARELRGVAVGKTIDARQIYDSENQRVFCVIDDGRPDFRPHALIAKSDAYATLTHRQLRHKLKPFRDKLIGLFSPVRKVEDIYEG